MTPGLTLDGIAQAAAEIEKIKSKLNSLQVERDSALAELASAKKELSAAKAREARIKAKLDQRGPVDSAEEAWLMTKRAKIEVQRGEGKTPVKLVIGQYPVIRAQTIQEAVEKACKRHGGPSL